MDYDWTHPSTWIKWNCATCGRPHWSQPSLVRRSGVRYCDRVCYDDRLSESPAMEVLRILGGGRAVAAGIGITYRTVRRWRQKGIPSAQHHALLVLAAKTGHAAEITHLKLELACQPAKRRKATQCLSTQTAQHDQPR